MPPIFRFVALLLIPFLVQVPLSAQLPAQNTATLRIRALTESAGQNTLLVEVTDAQGAPVSGSAVTFRLPQDGPSGTFADGARVAVVNTDTSGRAQVRGIRWTAPGLASVRVTATKGTAHAGILVEQQALPHTQNADANLAPAPIPPPAPKPIVSVPPPASPPKPALTAVLAPKPPDPETISQKPATHQDPQSATAVPRFPAAEPAIEPPHVSITSLGRKEANTGQVGNLSQPGSAEPNVVITGAGQRSHGGSKKWIILAAIAAGAAGGAAYMLSRGKSSASTAATSSSGVSIGAPTISIGAP